MTDSPWPPNPLQLAAFDQYAAALLDEYDPAARTCAERTMTGAVCDYHQGLHDGAAMLAGEIQGAAHPYG